MALQLPPLPSLRLFEAAGRLQSFRLAVDELHLTPSAVSHGIVALERWLGAVLFERRTNGVVLTAAGKDYLAFVSEALAMIAVGTRRLPNARGHRRVSISVAPSFASRWLVERLGDFRARHPDVSIAIDTSQRQVGFPTDSVDLAIRMARAPWPGLVSSCLFTERLVPVCAPAFLAQHGKRRGVDLAKVPLLQVSSTTEDWAAWLDPAGLTGIGLSTGLSFDTAHMAVDAAAAGLGWPWAGGPCSIGISPRAGSSRRRHRPWPQRPATGWSRHRRRRAAPRSATSPPGSKEWPRQPPSAGEWNSPRAQSNSICPVPPRTTSS
jgi:DNA-binding transcriptional LysR family regulator